MNSRFNFKMMNTLGVLKDEEFKVAYFILNRLAIENTNRVKIYRAVLAELTNKSERTISRITDILEKKCIFKKDIVSNSRKTYNYYSIHPKYVIDDTLNKYVIDDTLTNEENNSDIGYGLQETSPILVTDDTLKKNYNNKNIYNNKPSIDNVTIDTLQVSGDTYVTDDNESDKEITIMSNTDTSGVMVDDFFNFDSLDDDMFNDITDNNITKKENEMSDERTNGMNVMSECNERQARENESSESEKKNITSTSAEENKSSMGDCNETNEIPNENGYYTAPAADKYARWRNEFGMIEINNKCYPTPQQFIDRLEKNVEKSTKFMYEARFNVKSWKMQYEYMLIQLGNLKMFDEEEYLRFKKTFLAKWWNNTKQYFPEGYEKYLKKPS